MSRPTFFARFVRSTRRSAQALILGTGLLASSLAGAQTVGDLEGELVAIGDWSATDTAATKEIGGYVEPPPPDTFWPESDCPIVEGEPRCLYVIHHDSFLSGTAPAPYSV